MTVQLLPAKAGAAGPEELLLRHWRSRLLEAAPKLPPYVRLIVATLLAGNASSDALLLVADALDEACSEPQAAMLRPDMMRLSDLLRAEAPGRAV